MYVTKYMNILFKHESHNGTQLFVNTINSNYMVPLITRPTRYTDNSSLLIDNIFTNKPDDTSIAGILVADISDHLPIFYISKNVISRDNMDKPMFKMVASRQLTDANINRLKHELSLIDCSDINNLINANQAYDCFLSKFNTAINLAMPMMQKRVKYYSKTKQALGNPSIIKSIHRKNSLYKRYLTLRLLSAGGPDINFL